jgi:FAS-associated factor 2
VRTVWTHLLVRRLLDHSQDSLVIWAVDVATVEGSRAAMSLSATAFPFLCLLLNHGDRRLVIRRWILEDGRDRSRDDGAGEAEVAGMISDVVREFGPTLAALKAQRWERGSAQRLRDQQNAAYQASLLADQRKVGEKTARRMVSRGLTIADACRK